MSAEAESKSAAALQPQPPPPSEGRGRFPPPQLRIHDRSVYVGFGATPLGEGLTLADLALVVPEVSFPFDIAGAAATRYQKKKCKFGYCDVELDHGLLHRALHKVQQGCSEHIASLSLRLSAGPLEGEGQVFSQGGLSPFTFRIGFQPEGTAVLAVVYDLRLYGPAPLPAPFLAALLGRAAHRAGAVPGGEPWGASGVTFDPVPELLKRAVPLRGFRLPDMDNARLAQVVPGPKSFHLHFADGGRAEMALDEELLTALEGTRSFAEGEELLRDGDLAAAEAYYLRRGEPSDAHPFAQERLLALLSARPDAQDLSLDLAQALRRNRPGAAIAYWAEAHLRLARGEGRRAGELYLELAELSKRRGEEIAAFHALAAAGRALLDPAPSLASRAFQDALALRPDDLPCLLSLATAADRACEPEGAMRAYRRIAALARDPHQASRAHVRLGDLLVRLSPRDRPAARLHYDAALRLSPDDPDALLGLAKLCRASGEHLRALRNLDRLRAVARSRGEAAVEARAALLSGEIWDQELTHPGNALLRLQEAAQLAPLDGEAPLRTAELLERLGRHAEALEGYQQVVVLSEGKTLGPGGEAFRKTAHQAHHALARIATERLSDTGLARRHFEGALALEPDDAVALRAMMPEYRRAGSADKLAHACERCAAASSDPLERAALLAEAGALRLSPLGQFDKSERLLEQALLFDPSCRAALRARADLYERKGDGKGLCRLLLRLVELCEPKEKPSLLRRLGRAARELAQDLDLAADAFARSLSLEPGHLATLAELVQVQRQRGDDAALARALSDDAQALEAEGEFADAAATLRELALLEDQRLGRSEDALSRLEHALVLAPEDREVLLSLGELSLKTGKAAAAREAFRSLLGAQPAPAEAAELQIRLGQACEALGERAAAVDAYAAAFADKPGDDVLAERLDALLADAGRERDRAAVRRARARAQADSGRPGAAAASFLAAAEIQLRLDEREGAAAAFEDCLSADADGPTAPRALEALATMALDEGDQVRAGELIARRADFEADPRTAARALYRAADLAKQSSPDSFKALLAKAVSRDGLYPPARASLAYLRLAERELAQALAHAEVALSGRDDPDALDADAALELERLAARAARELGDFDSARAHLSAYSQGHPENTEALAELADLHRKADDRAGLAAALSVLVERFKGERARRTLVEYSGLLWEQGRHDEARAALRRALGLDPDDVAALDAMADALDRREDAPERARVLLRLADLARDPEEVERRLVDCGQALLEAGRNAEAAQALSRAARTSRRPARALELLAEACRAGGDSASEAEALLRRARLASDQGEPDAAARHLALAQRLVELGKSSEARAALTRALSLSPDPQVEAEALSALVELLESRGERTPAAEHLLRLAELLKGSERSAALVRRAEHLRALSRRDAAREAALMAVSAFPADRRALALVRDLSKELGDLAGYAQALESLLALPQADRRQEAIQALDLGRTWRRLGVLDRAEIALRRATALERSNPEPARELYEVLVERDSLEEALPLGEKLAVRMADASQAAQWLLGLSRLAAQGLGDRGLALRYARLAHERDRADVRVREQLADSLYLAGSLREALPLYQRLAASADFGADARDAAERCLRLADLAFEAGERDVGLATLRALLEREPICAPAADRLFFELVEEDPNAAVEGMARHAEALAPGSRTATLWLKLSELSRTSLSDLAQAARFLENARAGTSDPLPIDLARADLLRALGDQEALLQTLRQIAAQARSNRQPDRALAALSELSEGLRAEGDLAGAAEALAEAAEVCIDDQRLSAAAERLRAQGELLAAGDPLAAERCLRRAFQLDPADLASALRAAELSRSRGDLRGEAELLEASVALLPSGHGRAEHLLRLARLALELGESALANQALEQALAGDADFDEARALYEERCRNDGRFAALAQSLESRAARTPRTAEKIAWLRQAAQVFQADLSSPSDAARVLLAARDADPADLELSELAGGALRESGQADAAAQLDGQVLARDPLREAAFARHRGWLRERGDLEGLALLLELRSSRQQGLRASEQLLEAAAIRSGLGHEEAAADDERRAFELSPQDDRSFAAVVARTSSRSTEELAQVMRQRAQAVPSEALSLHRTRAELLLGAANTPAAREAIEEALALAPDDAQSLAIRGEIAERLGGLHEAEPFDRKLVACATGSVPLPQLAHARYRLGFVACDRADDRAAAEHLEAALALESQGERAERALSLLGAVYARRGDRAALYRVSMARADRLSGDARAAALRDAAAAAPDSQAASIALEQLVALLPGDAGAQARLGHALRDLGRHEQALASLERAAALGESAPALLCEAAQIAQAQLNDLPRARSLRARARALAPDDLSILRACLDDLRSASDAPALAAALARLGRSPDPREAGDARLERAEVLDRSGNRDAASEAWLDLVGRGPQEPGFKRACERAPQLLQELGRHALAAEALAASAVLQTDPAEACRAFERAAELLDGPGKDEAAALRMLERAAQAAPSHPAPFAAKAALLERRGRPVEQALALEQQAAFTADKSERARLLAQAAATFRSEGKPADCRRALEGALEANPSLLPARLALSEVLAEMGEVAAAQSLLLAFQSGDPTERATAVHRAGLFAKKLGRAEEADRLFIRAFLDDATDGEAFVSAHEALVRAGDSASLRQAIDRRLEVLAHSGNAGKRERAALLCERAELLAKEPAGRADAEESFRQALSLTPGAPRALAGLRELATASGNLAAVCTALEAELAIIEEPSKQLSSLAQLGDAARLLGDHARAAAAFARAVDAARACRDRAAERNAIAELAREQLALGQADSAISTLRELLSEPESPEQAALRELHAEALLRLGDREGARRELLASVKLDPLRESALARLQTWADADAATELAAALAARAAALPVGEERQAALAKAASAFRAADDRAGESKVLVELLAGEPNRRDAFLRLADLFTADRNVAKLRGLFDERIAAAAEDRPALLEDLGGRLVSAGEPREASEVFERALAARPDSENLAAQLASALVVAGLHEPETAHPRLRAGPASPSFPQVAKQLGRLAEQAGRLEEALVHLDEAARQLPGDAAVQEARLRLGERLGRPQSVLEACTALLSDSHRPELAALHLRAAKACRSLGQAAEELSHLEVAVLKGVAEPDDYLRMAELYLAKRSFADGAAALTWHAEQASDRALRRHSRLRAAQVYADELSDFGHALSAVERALNELPDDRELLELQCDFAERLEDPDALVRAADGLANAFGQDALEKRLPALARALSALGLDAEALTRYRQALERDFREELAAEARALAQSAADAATLAFLELKLAEGLTADKDAAARLRAVAELDRRENPQRAAELLTRARQLDPAGADLVLEGELRAQTATPQSVAQLAELARLAPAAAAPRRALARLVRESGDSERARLLESAERYFEGQPPAGPLPGLADLRVTDEVRARVADALALGELAQFLRACAPALGQVFGTSGPRLGIAESDRAGPLHAPALASRARQAQQLVGLADLQVYLSPKAGSRVLLEPGAPDRVVVGVGALTGALGPGGLDFLLVRAGELSRSGAACALVAGAAGLADLLSCALAACGEDLLVPEPYAARVPELAEALAARGKPAPALVQKALHALSSLEPEALLTALQLSAGRLALLAVGDVGAALRATLAARGGAADPESAQALIERDPLLRDLLATALRDDLAELRAALRSRP